MRAKVAIALVAIALALVLLEVGLRVYLANFGDDRQKVLYLYSRDEINAQESHFRGMAFLNYGLAPTHGQVNALGYRGSEITIPKPQNKVRIVALGGSTTYGIYLDSWRAAYPHQLELALREGYGHADVEVVNAGVPGYTSWESAVNLLLRIPDLEPDLVIVYHGVNDINPRLSDPAFYDGLNLGKGFWTDDQDPLPGSALYRLALKRLGQEIKVSYSLGERFQQPLGYRSCGLDLSGAEPICRNLDMTVAEVLRTNPPHYYERNLRYMVTIARSLGIDVALITWAYSPFEYAVPGGDFMTVAFRQEAVADHNAIVRRVAEDEGAMFYDLASTMPGDRPYWIDGLHMSKTGTAEMATQLAAYLDSTGALSD